MLPENEEVAVISKLIWIFRCRKQEDFVGLSFTTISASGSNAAIIHYTPSNETDRLINRDEMYLCDSGGQYKYVVKSPFIKFSSWSTSVIILYVSH